MDKSCDVAPMILRSSTGYSTIADPKAALRARLYAGVSKLADVAKLAQMIKSCMRKDVYLVSYRCKTLNYCRPQPSEHSYIDGGKIGDLSQPDRPAVGPLSWRDLDLDILKYYRHVLLAHKARSAPLESSASTSPSENA